MRRLALVAFACALGCSQSQEKLGLPVTDTNVAGAFALISANGHAIPYLGAAYTSTDQYDLVSDTLTLTAPSTWQDSEH